MSPLIDLGSTIRVIPDFPVQGILFRDITTLLKRADGLRAVVEQLAARYRDQPVDKIGRASCRERV